MNTFTIAFVCTGNRFRSPLAAAFVHRLTLGVPVETESYGTLRTEGVPALPEALEIAVSCGIALSEHRSRYVNNAALENVDLVLGFEPVHVRQAVVDAHSHRERSFTLSDFVPLLAPYGARERDVVGRARSIVADAGARFAASTGLRSASIADPFGGPWKGYIRAAIEIRELTIALVEGLFGVTDASVLPPIPTRRARARGILRR